MMKMFTNEKLPDSINDRAAAGCDGAYRDSDNNNVSDNSSINDRMGDTNYHRDKPTKQTTVKGKKGKAKNGPEMLDEDFDLTKTYAKGTSKYVSFDANTASGKKQGKKNSISELAEDQVREGVEDIKA